MLVHIRSSLRLQLFIAHFVACRGSDIFFATVDTNGPPLASKISTFQDNIVNLGDGKSWSGFDTKLKLLSTWLQDLDEDKIVVFFDGDDVFSGGCSSDDLLKHYNEIISSANGPKIVFGAELACGEQDCTQVPDVPSQYKPEVWQNFNTCGSSRWSPQCGKTCYLCGKVPEMKFLNSGFFMGPVQEVKSMVQETLENWNTYNVIGGDQGAYATYWLLNKHRVTLDYSSQLVLSLSDVSANVLKYESPNVFRNVAFDRVQCFIHGNGRGRSVADELRKALESQNIVQSEPVTVKLGKSLRSQTIPQEKPATLKLKQLVERELLPKVRTSLRARRYNLAAPLI